MTLPRDCDPDRIAEAAIGLMYLTFYGPENEIRASTGLGNDVLGLLHSKGWIGDPNADAGRSVRLTDDGEAQAVIMFHKYFEKRAAEATDPPPR